MNNKNKELDLKNLLDFLLDKVEDCYYEECKKVVGEYLKEEV